ncbi:diguanylate cyclase [Klenkia sp. PcliD-1-E]|uniref:GGDEF domain-containing protein n=1 Tax=Klenkia sp. PcliD-1-E TaxID=2954492 RepID=UPI0020969369|nr:GGDEF domain-containing protein [Klenkia sp. PcliD-1-E]MCO7219858.1 GGDEF domain-containing protein [Klenkia sp. PcliD-1-E]
MPAAVPTTTDVRRWLVRGPGPTDGRTAARLIAALLVVGAALGSLNLLVDGVLRPGGTRWVYAGAMALLVSLAVVVRVRDRVGPRLVAVLVLVGDLVYVVVALSITDPVQYAPPLMLLFCAFSAAWFLDGWPLRAHLAVVPVACWLALQASFEATAALAVQVVVQSVILDVTTLGVVWLRRQVQRLVADTERLSSTDPLTGLANRRSLVAGGDRLWRQAQRDGASVAACVLDLDRFKELNDEHGHAAGDAVLQAVATQLAGTVRPADVLARTGGEEMVVLGLVRGSADARQLGERLRAAVQRAGDRHPVTASVGVAVAGPHPDDDPQDAVRKLIDRADLAMYTAKQTGRDRVELADGAVPRPRVGGS